MTKFKGPGQWFAQAKAKPKATKHERSGRPLTPLARRRHKKETHV